MQHNHLTRDIKAPGVCPACDETRVPLPVDAPITLDPDRRVSIDVTELSEGISTLHFAYGDATFVPEPGRELRLRLVGFDR